MAKDEKKGKRKHLELVRSKPAKQKELPGFEKKRIKAVDDAAEEYVEIRDERMGLTEKEVAAKAKLIRVCVENKVTKYLDTSVSRRSRWRSAPASWTSRSSAARSRRRSEPGGGAPARPTKEGERLMRDWFSCLEEEERRKRDANRASCDLANATIALGKWMLPPDAEVGEKVCMWLGAQLIQAEKLPSGDAKITIRATRK